MDFKYLIYLIKNEDNGLTHFFWNYFQKKCVGYVWKLHNKCKTSKIDKFRFFCYSKLEKKMRDFLFKK